MPAVSTKHNFPDSPSEAEFNLPPRRLRCATISLEINDEPFLMTLQFASLWWVAAVSHSGASAALPLKGQHANAFHLFSTAMHNSVQLAVPLGADWHAHEEPPESK